jgi:DNA-binding transcriptional LysR family regulator
MDHLQSIRLFVKAAEFGSFARAADLLDVSRAVTSRHIADLEAQLCTRLFNRTTRKLSLTEAGQVYLERVRQILDELEDAERLVMARNREPVGTLRISAPADFGLQVLASVLHAYTERFPKVVPDLTLVDRPVDLVAERFDVGIVMTGQMNHASVVARRVATERMTVCAAPAYLKRHGEPTHPGQLASHQCLSLPGDFYGTGLTFVDAERTAHAFPSNAVIANNTSVLRQFALLGTGIAILPGYLVRTDILQGTLVPLLSEYRLPQLEIRVAYPARSHLSAKVRTFIDHLVAHFAGTAALPPSSSAAQDCERASPQLEAA